jgi:hypothetical protein
MCGRLKKLQKRRAIIDKVIEDENKKKLLQKQSQLGDQDIKVS